MSEKFASDLFDIKNDRRLSVYLYRAGFGCWLLYIVSGARFLQSLTTHRTDFGIFAFFLMVMGGSAAMVYEYYHDPAGFDQKKKWLIIGYGVLAGLIYFILLHHQLPTFQQIVGKHSF